jgi:hypothetical protein
MEDLEVVMEHPGCTSQTAIATASEAVGGGENSQKYFVKKQHPKM